MRASIRLEHCGAALNPARPEECTEAASAGP